MNIRKIIFNLLRNKESRIINKSIKDLEINLYKPHKINDYKLNLFLDYITEKSEYYNKYKNKDIISFPIMNKKHLSENYDSITTVNESEYDNYLSRQTSGSYGTPFKFIVSKSKILSQQAQIIYFGKWSGFDIGTRHIYLRSTEPSLKNQLVRNQYVIKPEKLTDEWLKMSIEKLIKIKPDVIIGYPTTLELISKEINTRNQQISFIKGIITSGESLTDDAKAEITEAFKIKPLSRYSSEELGVLANSLPNEEGMILNQVDFLIEILDENNEPVKENQVGRIIVTDFNSQVTPLIRYDTGDLAKVLKIEDDLVTHISHVEGRIVETLYTTDGEALTPYAINIKMRDYNTIQQFQFIQETSTQYTLNIVPNGKHDESQYKEIIDKIESILGDSAKITLHIVDGIEPLPSGKRPYIINKLLKTKTN